MRSRSSNAKLLAVIPLLAGAGALSSTLPSGPAAIAPPAASSAAPSLSGRTIASLAGGSYYLRFEERVAGETNERRHQLAASGLTTFPAHALNELWFSIDDQGRIAALRTRVSTLPERRLWSETQFRAGDQSVRLEHYAACARESLSLPPPTAAALFREMGGPPGPPGELGFTAADGSATGRFRLQDGPDVYVLERQPSGPIYRRSSTDDPTQELAVQRDIQLSPSTADAPLAPIGQHPCWPAPLDTTATAPDDSAATVTEEAAAPSRRRPGEAPRRGPPAPGRG